MEMKWLVVGVLAALAFAAALRLLTRRPARVERAGMPLNAFQETEVDGAMVAYEPGFRELAAVHYRDRDHDLKAEAEWVGWGENQKFYLVVDIPAASQQTSHPMTDADVQLIASRVSRGLTAFVIPHAVFRRGTRVPIPAEECEEGLRSYQRWKESKGWRVTIDRAKPLIEETPISVDLAGRSEEEIQEETRRGRQSLEWLVGYRILQPLLLLASDDVKAALRAAPR
jgi:hypothetical protein